MPIALYSNLLMLKNTEKWSTVHKSGRRLEYKAIGICLPPYCTYNFRSPEISFDEKNVTYNHPPIHPISLIWEPKASAVIRNNNPAYFHSASYPTWWHNLSGRAIIQSGNTESGYGPSHWSGEKILSSCSFSELGQLLIQKLRRCCHYNQQYYNNKKQWTLHSWSSCPVTVGLHLWLQMQQLHILHSASLLHTTAAFTGSPPTLILFYYTQHSTVTSHM